MAQSWVTPAPKYFSIEMVNGQADEVRVFQQPFRVLPHDLFSCSVAADVEAVAPSQLVDSTAYVDRTFVVFAIDQFGGALILPWPRD